MSDKQDCIKFFKALANDERIEIIQLLRKNHEMCAQDVEKCFYLEQSTTSHHLNTLKKAGVIKSRKEGRKVIYSVDDASLKSLWALVSQLVLG